MISFSSLIDQPVDLSASLTVRSDSIDEKKLLTPKERLQPRVPRSKETVHLELFPDSRWVLIMTQLSLH
jgi:hypothetical protein